MLEALLGPLGNNFGILNEQIDPATGMDLGTFPQGLNHLALLHATFSIRRTPGAVGTLEFYSNLQIVFAGTTCRTTVALTLLASSGKSGPNPTAPGDRAQCINIWHVPRGGRELRSPFHVLITMKDTEGKASKGMIKFVLTISSSG